jgi:hypothetical protein
MVVPLADATASAAEAALNCVGVNRKVGGLTVRKEGVLARGCDSGGGMGHPVTIASF